MTSDCLWNGSFSTLGNRPCNQTPLREMSLFIIEKIIGYIMSDRKHAHNGIMSDLERASTSLLYGGDNVVSKIL